MGQAGEDEQVRAPQELVDVTARAEQLDAGGLRRAGERVPQGPVADDLRLEGEPPAAQRRHHLDEAAGPLLGGQGADERHHRHLGRGVVAGAVVGGVEAPGIPAVRRQHQAPGGDAQQVPTLLEDLGALAGHHVGAAHEAAP